ncbi:MAG: hypothetical protein JJU35_03540 [Balneolales bacterium]|nr:hypothetical protein [Balneolales bacterium]
MQKFFGIKLRLSVVLLVLGGFMLTHLPQHQAVKEYNSFSNWVMQHLSERTSDAGADTLRSESLRTLLNEMMSGKSGTAREKPSQEDHTRMIPFLYLAWSQHHDASDMAGTFSNDRLSFQLIFKHHAAVLSGILFSASGHETHPRLRACTLQLRIAGFLPFSMRALISGQFVNAP